MACDHSARVRHGAHRARKNSLSRSGQIRNDLLHTIPDLLGLQRSERELLSERQPTWLQRITSDRLNWKAAAREIKPGAPLHPSVIERLAADGVPQALVRHEAVLTAVTRAYEAAGAGDPAASAP